MVFPEGGLYPRQEELDRSRQAAMHCMLLGWMDGWIYDTQCSTGGALERKTDCCGLDAEIARYHYSTTLYIYRGTIWITQTVNRPRCSDGVWSAVDLPSPPASPAVLIHLPWHPLHRTYKSRSPIFHRSLLHTTALPTLLIPFGLSPGVAPLARQSFILHPPGLHYRPASSTILLPPQSSSTFSSPPPAPSSTVHRQPRAIPLPKSPETNYVIGSGLPTSAVEAVEAVMGSLGPEEKERQCG